MIITCLLILLYSILKRPVKGLVRLLKDVDWKRRAQNVWSRIVSYSRRAGRAGSRVVLQFYYVMQEGGLSVTEKALVYAGIVYIVVPHDLLPRKMMKWFGVLDDVGVAAWILNRIGKHITPRIQLKVEETLDRWFGPVVTIADTE